MRTARVILSEDYFQGEIPIDWHDPYIKEALKAVPKNVVLVTSTFYPSKDGVMDPANQLRASLAHQFCKTASNLGYLAVVVDGGSDSNWCQGIRSIENIILLDQKTATFGSARREGYVVAADYKSRKIKVAIEPEKHPMLLHSDGHSPLAVAALPVYLGNADGTIPRRVDGMVSYPAQQAVSETDANLTVFNLFLDYVKTNNLPITVPYLDQMVGPRIMTQEMLEYLIKYPGIIRFNEESRSKEDLSVTEFKQYNHDMWESHFVPFWKMILDGRRIHGVPVDYIHPSEQTVLESIDTAFDEKRQNQLVAISTGARHFLKSYGQGFVDW